MASRLMTGFVLSMSMLITASAAFAKDEHAAHSTTKPAASSETAREAYDASMNRMHNDMMQGVAHDDADVAFAAGMLAHHVGAVEMARIQLVHGKDAQLRKLAQEVIDAQEAEIELLRNWLKTNAPDALPADASSAQQAKASHSSH